MPQTMILEILSHSIDEILFAMRGIIIALCSRMDREAVCLDSGSKPQVAFYRKSLNGSLEQARSNIIACSRRTSATQLPTFPGCWSTRLVEAIDDVCFV